MESQNRLKMVDISKKRSTRRRAQAQIKIYASRALIQKIRASRLPKGDCIVPAQVAGILAAKNISAIIPLCHQIVLSHVDIKFKFHKDAVEIISCVKANYATGVEMEALLACAVAALTIYDMAKALDKSIVMSDLRLLRKTGGKSGVFVSGK